MDPHNSLVLTLLQLGNSLTSVNQKLRNTSFKFVKSSSATRLGNLLAMSVINDGGRSPLFLGFSRESPHTTDGSLKGSWPASL